MIILRRKLFFDLSSAATGGAGGFKEKMEERRKEMENKEYGTGQTVMNTLGGAGLGTLVAKEGMSLAKKPISWKTAGKYGAIAGGLAGLGMTLMHNNKVRNNNDNS